MKIEVSPISKRRPSKKDGWIVRQTVAQLKQKRLQELSRDRPIRRTAQRHLTAIAAFLALLLLAVSAVTRWRSATFFPMLAPKDPQSVLGLAWQVHAGIIAIAFAGLALLLQFSTQSLIAGHTIRGALFRRTYFRPILTYCLIADVGLALVTAWFSTPSAVVIQMVFTILGSVALIAFAYGQVLRVFVQPGLTEGVGQTALLDLLSRSLDSNKALARANGRLEEVVNLSWSSSESSNTNVQRLVRSSRRQVLTDVNLLRLRDVLRELDAKSRQVATASEPPSPPGEGTSGASLEKSRRSQLHMLAQLGSSVDENKYVFYVTNPHLFTGDWEKLERRLLNALDWDSQPTQELQRFEAEINVLRDNIHEAISSGASARTRQGLEIIQAAMRCTVQAHEKASGATVRRLSDVVFNVAYGQEWEILMRAMSDLISGSSDTLSARTKQEIHNLLFRMLQDFCVTEELPAVQSCLNLVVADWSASLASPAVNGSQAQGYILFRLSEVTEFALPMSGGPAFQESAMSLLADTFINCAKAAVDQGDAEAAARAITFLRQTFEFESGADAGDAFRRSRELGLLVLLAWILFRKDRQLSGSETDRTAAEIESTIPQHNIWELARLAQETEDQSTLGWSWWESTINLNRHWYGFPTMPTYVKLAALKLASTRPFQPPSPPAENDVVLTHNLDELLTAIRGGNFRNLRDELTSVNLENVEETVKAVLDEVNRRRRDMLAQTRLDDARIQQFDRALRELLVDGSRPRLAKTIADGGTSGTARKIGYWGRLNKWYFVESDVIAEPERLGRNVAGNLIHQEEQAILSTILGAAPAYEAAAESIPDMLPDWLTSTEESRLIVTNSWDAFFQLIPFAQLQGLAWGDLLETALGIPVFRVYDDRPQYVAAFLTPRGVSCKLSQLTDEAEESSGTLKDSAILVSVRELTEFEVTTLAADTGMSQDDYRAQAIVEVREELSVDVRDSNYVTVWTLTTEDE
jgi:hypothetical protein